MVPVAGFIGGAYLLPSRAISAQRCVNLYVEAVPSNDKSQAVLLGTPGLSTIPSYVYSSEDFENPIRQGGIYVTSNNILIVVRGRYVYAYTGFDTDGSLIPYAGESPYAVTNGRIGDIHFNNNVSDRTPITMADNGVILLLSTADLVFKFNLDALGNYSDISAWSYGGFTHIGYLGSKFIVNTPYDTTNDPQHILIRESPLEWDGTFATWDDLASNSADNSADPIQGICVVGPDLLVLSTQSCEWFYDARNELGSLDRNTSVASSIGCRAKYSIARSENTVFWLGAGADGFNKIYKTQGFTPVEISTPAISQEISTYEDTEDALGFTYQIAGHTFYIITFQTADKSWQYDLTTGLWNELSSTNAAGQQERSRYIGMAAFEGKLLALDRVLNGPVILSTETYYEEEYSILRLRSSPHSYSRLNRVFFSRFQLDMQTGLDGFSMQLRWSNDGGYSWGNILFRTMGEVGEYTRRVIWNRLGQSRNRVWEIATTAPVPIRILGAWVEAEEGNN